MTGLKIPVACGGVVFQATCGMGSIVTWFPDRAKSGWKLVTEFPTPAELGRAMVKA